MIIKDEALELIKAQLESDPDFVYFPSLDNSLRRVIEAHPDGLSIDKIAKALMMSEEKVEELYSEALGKLREGLGADND